MPNARTVPDGWASYAKELGLRLQRARHNLGLSQEDVARRAGIATFTYQKFEKGESRPGSPMNPRLATVLALCQALEMSVTEFVGDAPRVA